MTKGISQRQLQYVDDLIKQIESKPKLDKSLEKMARGWIFHLLFLGAWQLDFPVYAGFSLFLVTSVMLLISLFSPSFFLIGLLSGSALALELFLAYGRGGGLAWITWRYILNKIREGYSLNDASDHLISEALASRLTYVVEEARVNSFPRYLGRLRKGIMIHDIARGLKWIPVVMISFIIIASRLAVPPISMDVLILVSQLFVLISVATFLLIIADSMSIQIVRRSRPSFLYTEELRQIVSEINRSGLMTVWRRLWNRI